MTVWSQNPRKQKDSHDWDVIAKWFPMFSCAISLFSRYRDGRVVLITFPNLCCAWPRTHHHSRSCPQDGGCSVLTWAERWGQDVLIYNACYCDLQQQQSDCCGDKRKQSAAHPHTAGYCWTKEDYLHWYKKQRILFLKLKINPANIYSKHLDTHQIQSDITVIIYALFFFLWRQDYCCYL